MRLCLVPFVAEVSVTRMLGLEAKVVVDSVAFGGLPLFFTSVSATSTVAFDVRPLFVTLESSAEVFELT